MSKSMPVRRRFDREFKLKALERLGSGEPIRSLAVEFGVRRQLLYKWRDAFAEGEPRRRGRPSKAEALARAADQTGLSALEIAEGRVAELERKVGRQAVELDFFRGALRRIKASRLVSE
jgi:transposase-like protein